MQGMSSSDFIFTDRLAMSEEKLKMEEKLHQQM